MLSTFNPGNIRPGPQQWQGQVGISKGFVVFDGFKNGIRALAKNLIAYYDNSGGPRPKYRSKDGTQIDTVEEAIYRWAPPADRNDTNAYVAMVCAELDCNKDDVFDFHNADFLFWIITAIGEQENGHDAFTHAVSDADIDAGIAAALA